MKHVHLKRVWAALKIRYPFFQAASSSSKTFTALLIMFLIWMGYSLSFIFQNEGMEKISENSVLVSLLSFPLQFMFVALAGISLIVSRTFISTEKTRIYTRSRTIPYAVDKEIPKAFRWFIGNRDVEFKFDSDQFYKVPPFLEASFRWSEFDREEFYLVNAGALDHPKLTLREVKSENEKLVMHLGFASFYDIFTTHYSPDLNMSNQSSRENGQLGRNSVRGILNSSLKDCYTDNWDINNFQNRSFKLYKYLPNPLGISGIIVLKCEDGESYVPLRTRKSYEAASQNEMEWSFSGLIEGLTGCTDSIYVRKILSKSNSQTKLKIVTMA